MIRPLAAVRASEAERLAARPGDDLVAPADVVMDRAFTLDARAGDVWPWLVQLGKRRAGWYLPRTVERLVPRRRRALRELDPRWTSLAVGEVIPDYGGRDATFTVALIEPARTIVYTSRRGRTDVSWSISLLPLPDFATRVVLRLRLGPVRRRRLAESLGGLFDLLTIAGLGAGLRERLTVRGS